MDLRPEPVQQRERRGQWFPVTLQTDGCRRFHATDHRSGRLTVNVAP